MDRMEILRKVAAGEITVDEAEKLLQEVSSQPKAEAEPEAANPGSESREGPAQDKAKRSETSSESRTDLRWLHVRVHDLETDRDQVKVNVPIGLIWPGFWFGSRCGWGWRSGWMRHWSWWDEVEEALESGKTGTLVDVEDDEHRKHVTVYVD
jgi:polyhydroxyalkanoate synthesis regulator phasin